MTAAKSDTSDDLGARHAAGEIDLTEVNARAAEAGAAATAADAADAAPADDTADTRRRSS